VRTHAVVCIPQRKRGEEIGVPTILSFRSAGSSELVRGFRVLAARAPE